jgi:hypothetical protein
MVVAINHLVTAYRVMFMAELVGLAGCYIWSLVSYINSLFRGERALRALYTGVAMRCAGIALLLLLLIVQVAGTFDEDTLGDVLTNLVIQIVVLFFFISWLFVDWRRFHIVQANVNDVAANAWQQVANTRKRIDKENAKSPHNRRATDIPAKSGSPPPHA